MIYGRTTAMVPVIKKRLSCLLMMDELLNTHFIVSIYSLQYVV
jgi:hypothetical protein